MTHHRPRNPRERGVRTGVFDIQGNSLEAPCAAMLAEELRKLANPQVAAVWLAPSNSLPAETSIANPGGLVRSELESVASWLCVVTSADTVEVPARLRAKLCASAVIAMPVFSPVEQLGVAAFPIRSSFERVRREAEHCLSDFALRLERYQRQRQLKELQDAVRVNEAPLPVAPRIAPTAFKTAANG